MMDLGVSKNSGTPKSSILIGFSIINHPFWGTPIFGNTHLMKEKSYSTGMFPRKKLLHCTIKKSANPNRSRKSGP